MKTLYFNQTYGAFRLCSYLAHRRPNVYQFRTLPASGPELRDGLQDPDSVFCLSIESLGDVRLAEAFFQGVRRAGVETRGWPKFLLGGAFFSYADERAFLRCFPETSLVVVGKGESALLHGLEQASRTSRKILQAELFETPEDLELQPALPWPPERPIAVSRGDFLCRWGRCRFCHHTPGRHSRQITMPQLCERLVRYYRAFGWQHFYLTDNHLAPDDLRFLLERLQAEKVRASLDVFGMRMTKEAAALPAYLLRTHMVRDIGWGLEMYSQRMLDLYRKGIRTEDMLPVLHTFADAGIRCHVHVLLGLPGCTGEDYERTCAFLQEHLCRSRLIDRAVVHWFVLSRPVLGRMADVGVRIRTRGAYHLNDYFGNTDELPEIRTVFQAFDVWDDRSRRWRAHDDVLLEHAGILRKILSLPGAHYDFRGFFIRGETWRDFWGGDLDGWRQQHPARIARPGPPGPAAAGGWTGLAHRWMTYAHEHQATEAGRPDGAGGRTRS